MLAYCKPTVAGLFTACTAGPDVHVGVFVSCCRPVVTGVLATIPVTVRVVVPVTMKMLVSVAIIVTMPVPTMRVVVGRVVVRRVVSRCIIDDGHTGQGDTDADIGMRFGGHAVRNAGDPQSGT
jgi:hypothetical protein